MRQKLGQHFLTNRSVLRKIARVLADSPGKKVVEIGPGHGELTEELLLAEPGSEFDLIERDSELAEELRRKYALRQNIRVHEGDALKILPNLAGAGDYKLAGNIPYYLTGFLLRTIGEMPKKPSVAVFTIQKEVAERIAAQPPRMNRLAAAVQFWAEPKIIGLISRKDFDPPPEVDSATILLAARPETDGAETYYAALTALFRQPRKTILNNLSAGSSASKDEVASFLKKAGFSPAARPQDLSVSDIRKLSGLFVVE